MIPLDLIDIEALENVFGWVARLDPRPTAIASLHSPVAGALYFYNAAKGPLPVLPEGAAVLVRPGIQVPAHARQIEVTEPKREFASITRVLREVRQQDDVEQLSTGAFVSASAEIGAGCRIMPGAYIGPGASLGDACIIECGAVVYGGVRLEAGCRVLANAVVGSDGFGYAVQGDSWPEPIAHLGGAEIGPEVDIGPGACVSAGTIDPTIIGEGTKIEGQVYIGHNVKVGNGAMICAHATVGGSAVLGDRVWLHAGAFVKTKISVGDRAEIGMGAVVMKSVAPSVVIMGEVAGEVRTRLRREAKIDRMLADWSERWCGDV